MVPADETFDATWPFAARFHEVPATATARAFRLHYVDEGPPSAVAVAATSWKRAANGQVASKVSSAGIMRDHWHRGHAVASGWLCLR